jgi:putative membrane protein
MNTRALLSGLGVLGLFVLLGGLIAAMMGPGMMWGYGTGGAAPTDGGWPWGLAMGLGGLVMLGLWAALIVGVILLVRSAMSQATGATVNSGVEDPQAILGRRYAAGEIDQPTYERMKRELAA